MFRVAQLTTRLNEATRLREQLIEEGRGGNPDDSESAVYGLGQRIHETRNILAEVQANVAEAESLMGVMVDRRVEAALRRHFEEQRRCEQERMW